MAGIDSPGDGTSAALISSLFGNIEGDRSPEVNVFTDGSLLQQMGVPVQGLFDVLQVPDVARVQQQQKLNPGVEGVGDSNGIQAFMEEVSRSFMRSGSISTGLVEQQLDNGGGDGGGGGGGGGGGTTVAYSQPGASLLQGGVMGPPPPGGPNQSGAFRQGGVPAAALNQSVASLLDQQPLVAPEPLKAVPGGFGGSGGFEANRNNPPKAMQGGFSGSGAAGGKELLDILSAQMCATATTGRDVSLEELIASGHVSAETLLNLVESLKAILPADVSQAGGMSTQNLAALAEILGLNQGESNVPISHPMGAAAPPAPSPPGAGPVGGGFGRVDGLLGQLQQQQHQQRQQQQLGQQVDIFALQQQIGPTASASAGTLALAGFGARSNLGPGGGGAGPTYSGSSNSSSAGALGGSLGLTLPGANTGTRPQPLSLRTRRGLPDLPVHRPNAGKPGSQPLSPLSGSATPSPRSCKRVANGPLQQGLCWPLSPASKSPRADGQMSPGGSQLGGPGPLSLPNGPKYPPSPTTSLLGDLSKLAVHRPQTSPSGARTPPADAGIGAMKLEVGMLGQVSGDGEVKHLEGAGDGGGDLFDVGDELGESDSGAGDERTGDGSGESGVGGGSGALGGAGRAKHSTKPRSVAERLRRERIAVRLQRLKEVMPKTDARIDTSAMLEDAVVYIKSLQSRCRSLEKQNEMLTAQVARLTQQQQQCMPNGNILQMNQLLRPMGP